MVGLRVPIAAAVVAALLASCPVDEGEENGPRAVGVLVAVLNPQTLINGERAAGGDRIPAGAVVSTDGNGAARVSLEGPTDCEIRPDSAVEVEPTPGLLMRITRGTTVCDGAETTSTATIEAAGTKVNLRDATLAIELPDDEDEDLTVRSHRGDVEVMPPSGPPLMLQPREEIEVSQNGIERLPRPFDATSLDPSERSAVERVKDDSPISSTVPSTLPTTTSSSSPLPSTSGPTTTTSPG